MAIVKIDCWCCRESVGSVRVVTRSGVCVVVCIISRRFNRVDWGYVLGKVVVISSRYRVCSSTSCVCVSSKACDCVG